jgi:hypothetical protein
MKVVASSGRAKEGDRQGKVEKQKQVGCQAGTEGVVGWEKETSRQMQHGRKREADRRYRQAGKQVESSHTDKGQKQEDAQIGRQMSREGIRYRDMHVGM